MFDDFWKYALGLVTVAGLIMAFARTGPDDAKANLVRWSTALGLPRLQAWAKTHRPDLWIARIGTVVAAMGSSTFTYYATFDKLKENISFNKQDLDNRIKTQSAEIDKLTKRIAELEQPNPDPDLRPSIIFGLTDVTRWRLSNSLRQLTKTQNGNFICQSRVWGKPSSQSSAQAWGEIKSTIEASGWTVQGGSTPKTVFPDGILVNVSSNNGPAFNCGYRLAEMFEGLHVQNVNFRAEVTTPDLIECKDCLEVVVGDVTIHK